jgi:hypothetical protein
MLIRQCAAELTAGDSEINRRDGLVSGWQGEPCREHIC